MRTEAVREHFRQQVEDYPDLMRRLIPFYDDQRDTMGRVIRFESERHFCVLDLGCGPGLLAERILGNFPSAELPALDLTSHMLDVCRERIGAIGQVSKIMFCKGVRFEMLWLNFLGIAKFVRH